jgi:hypothetical protein
MVLRTAIFCKVAIILGNGDRFENGDRVVKMNCFENTDHYKSQIKLQ